MAADDFFPSLDPDGVDAFDAVDCVTVCGVVLFSTIVEPIAVETAGDNTGGSTMISAVDTFDVVGIDDTVWGAVEVCSMLLACLGEREGVEPFDEECLEPLVRAATIDPSEEWCAASFADDPSEIFKTRGEERCLEDRKSVV